MWDYVEAVFTGLDSKHSSGQAPYLQIPQFSFFLPESRKKKNDLVSWSCPIFIYFVSYMLGLQ